MTVKQQILKFLLKTALLFGIVFLLDLAIGKTLQYFYFRQSSGLFYRTNYAMDSTQAQVLIFGSSRANHHYDPRVISEKLEKSCYNTGRDGNFLLFNYAIFKTIILRYKPEIVIFDVDKDFLTHSAEEYERLSSLLPYKGRNRAIEQVIALRGPFEKLKCLSQLYRYNSSLLTIAIGNTEVNKRRKSDIEGYVPLPGTLEMKRPDTDTSAVDPADPQKVSALLDIIMECKKYNIRLVFANSPIFIESINLII